MNIASQFDLFLHVFCEFIFKAKLKGVGNFTHLVIGACPLFPAVFNHPAPNVSVSSYLNMVFKA